MIDRRTVRRFFLFNPDEGRKVEQLFWYCLAVAANKYGVQVHAATLMSNHFHIVLTDVRGELPHFLQMFVRLLALSTKAFRGWSEEVMNGAGPSVRELVTPSAVAQSMAYSSTNAVSAGAVRYAKDWPGANTLPRDVGRRVIHAKRPEYYFRADNPDWPDEATLDIVMPECLVDEHGSEEAARRELSRITAKHERRARKKLDDAGRTFLGVRRVLRTRHTSRASSFEPFAKLNPKHVAAGDADAARAAIRRDRAFNEAYDQALARWQAGNRRAVFPHGTWWMRVHHGVRCQPPP